MPNGAEIIERAVNEFQRVQAHMKNAKRENAVETYAELKKDYKSLKTTSDRTHKPPLPVID